MQIEFILSGQRIYFHLKQTGSLFWLIKNYKNDMFLLNLINFSSNGTCTLRNNVYFHF